jgi:hypothetical protein
MLSAVPINLDFGKLRVLIKLLVLQFYLTIHV